MTELLGLTLEQALYLCAQQGIEPAVQYTAALRHPVEKGQYRVVRVQDGGKCLTCARVPQLTEDISDETEENR